jgi:hypothetical protein
VIEDADQTGRTEIEELHQKFDKEIEEFNKKVRQIRHEIKEHQLKREEEFISFSFPKHQILAFGAYEFEDLETTKQQIISNIMWKFNAE